MLKIIVEYVTNELENNFFQEVKNYNFNELKIPDNCFVVKFWRYSVNEKENGTIILEKRTLEKMFYVGKEITLEELKQKYGDNPEYDIFIRNVERNKLRVIVDKIGKLHVIEENSCTENFN